MNRNDLILETKRILVEEDPRLISYTDAELREAIEAQIERINSNVSYKDRYFVLNNVYDSIRGLGILDEIVRDESITEIMINGHDSIFIEKGGKQYKYDRGFESKEDLSRIITLFVQKAGRSVSEANPIVDTRLEDGSRVNVVMPPVALDGATVTIRRFPKEPMTVEKLIKFGSFPPEIAEILEIFVKARFNIFVSGGTGSGKTTFLNALSNYIPRTDRVITVEDSAELQIKAVDNLVRLETKVSTSKDTKEISIQDLIKSALRMRPDRIVVGEIRGAEAIDMLQAMNTGHDGSLSTGHANSAKDMLSRIETLVLRGVDLPLEAIRQQISSAVDIIIQLSRLRDHSRKTVEIVEVGAYNFETRQIELNPIYEFVESEHTTVEKVDGKLTRTKNPLINVDKLRQAGIYREI
ncbi:MAG: CpaF family protein [Defluviitaleaceae bacterium]|nr:CpaF family protein [Defluviitaleaceae bacterium]